MSDLFFEEFSNEQIAAVFGVMAACPEHDFLVLTKRPERMREWFKWVASREFFTGTTIANHAGRWTDSVLPVAQDWPLPNVWLGVSAEDQQRADERVPHLLATPAAVRFVSAEPLLGPIALHIPTRIGHTRGDGERNCDHCCNGDRCDDSSHLDRNKCPYCRGSGAARRLDWLIVGGESGPGARPCALEWIESVVEQCRDAGVACFVKQLGAVSVSEHRTATAEEFEALTGRLPKSGLAPNGEHWAWVAGQTDKKGGDPTEWPTWLRVRQFPEVRP
jgi:protein gp37